MLFIIDVSGELWTNNIYISDQITLSNKYANSIIILATFSIADQRTQTLIEQVPLATDVAVYSLQHADWGDGQLL
jgi:hypothetical protein